MILVNIESPFAGDVETNLRYARACMRDSIERGEAPIASHLLYTQPGILDDNDPLERRLGILCGFSWNQMAHLTAVYTDLGVTKGMQEGMDVADRAGRPVQIRQLGPQWDDRGLLCYNSDPHSAPNVLGKCMRCGYKISEPGSQA